MLRVPANASMLLNDIVDVESRGTFGVVVVPNVVVCGVSGGSCGRHFIGLPDHWFAAAHARRRQNVDFTLREVRMQWWWCEFARRGKSTFFKVQVQTATLQSNFFFYQTSTTLRFTSMASIDILRYQPLKGIFILYKVLVIVFVQLPFYAVSAIPRSWRPRRSWGIDRTVMVKLLRAACAVEMR